MISFSPHQLSFFAHQLTLRAASNSMDRMAGALLDAQVDLNPHQIDAALFATSNPLAKGVILADEVGLGKTIEAGLLIAQRWAERKRRILVIAPANLRKQWHQELADKFGIAAAVLEAKSYKQALKEGDGNPFDAPQVLITSYAFQKFHSDTERILATVLEREARRWFRPVSGQFNIYYRSGVNQPEYIPDFVVALEDITLMIETKKAKEVAEAQDTETEVKAKADQAVIWCKNASDYATKVGGKPWRYLLIPHDAVAQNTTLAYLVNRFGV